MTYQEGIDKYIRKYNKEIKLAEFINCVKDSIGWWVTAQGQQGH